jgi:DNA helicase-2/ATP-dependent DNA helicase PcrA
VLNEIADAGATPAIARFAKLIKDLQVIAERAVPIDKLVEAVVDRTNYRAELDRIYPDPMEREARIASIEELINAAAAYGKGKPQKSGEKTPLLRGFLNDIALGGPDQQDDKHDQLQRNAIALMTLHSAKGLEFPYVYMVGILPHKRTLEMPDDLQIDEERRLCYVGVTRAQERLTLSFALTRRKWGKPRETVPSRFLYEMTGQAENAAKARAAAVAGPHRKQKSKSATKRR